MKNITIFMPFLGGSSEPSKKHRHFVYKEMLLENSFKILYGLGYPKGILED